MPLLTSQMREGDMIVLMSTRTITTVAFDADDTLWANEDHFVSAQAQYQAILAPYRAEWDAQELYETEQRNLAYFGYGIKGFVLSMIETAIQVTDGAISSLEIGRIIDIGREMVHAPLELLPDVNQVIPALSPHFRLMIITKGDLFDQESKIARSGLADYFRHIEVVSDKTPSAYERILRRYDISPREFVMIGNSLRSDIMPVVDIGGYAIHVPYHLTWQHEHVDVDSHDQRWHTCANLAEVAQWLRDVAPDAFAQT
jgi:putative hydrolase of the HAD superfamily